MPDDPYPAWKRARCKWCAAGELFMGGLRRGAMHRLNAGPSDFSYAPCTAPREAEYIAELEKRLDLLEGTNRKIGGQLLEHSDEVNRRGELIAGLEQQNARLHTLRPRSEWHEDLGTVLWWHLPIQEPPCVGYDDETFGAKNADGSPTDCHRLLASGWLTHWSPLPDARQFVIVPEILNIKGPHGG